MDNIHCQRAAHSAQRTANVKINYLTVFAVLIPAAILIAPNPLNSAPIPLYDHSYRSFGVNDTSNHHYHLVTPNVSELWSVHNIALQFSNRYYYSSDTSLATNRALLYFADSIRFRDIDFNFRIRLDAPGSRVRDAGWTIARAGAANDPGFVYDPDRIVAHYTPNDHLKFGFGKDRVNYGPLALGGLLLSDYNEGLTGLYQQYTLGPFVLSGVTAQLNSQPADPSVDRTLVTQRYLSASRLSYSKEDYGFAFGQSIVYAGVGRSFELPYFFPFYIFHYGQMTDVRAYGNNGQNTFGSIDGYCKVYGLPLEVYGELLIDDFQAHTDAASRSVQNAVAWMAGLRLRGEAAPWYGFIEGGHISTYTYNHVALPMRYLLNDCFIGSPLGPDQQLLWGKFGREFYGSRLRTDANFWLRRSGERNINYRHSDILGTANEKQPYGVVEDELSFWQSVSYRRFYVDVEARGGATLYRNRGNAAAGWAAYPFFGVFLSSAIRVNAE